MQFDHEGRLVRWPSKFSVQRLAMWLLWTRFEGRRVRGALLFQLCAIDVNFASAQETDPVADFDQAMQAFLEHRRHDA